MNRYVEARLINFSTIRVYVSNYSRDGNYTFVLITNNNERQKLNGRIIERKEGGVIYEFKLNYEIKLGNNYHIAITNIGIYPLNVTPVTETPNFDKMFAYSGDDLGVTYSKKQSSFAIWAPLASNVVLEIDNKDIYIMKRSDRGVYRRTINGDLRGHFYNYYVTNCGITSKTVDPYAKASTPNSKSSVILDFSRLEMKMNDKWLPPMNSILDAVIYEGSVRDLTIDPSTNIVHKGKFLGLVEEKRLNKDGYPVGFDYISNLGITHLQLLPVYDFATTDELNPKDSYNWGYDPAQYFVPEGSYASNVNNPESRIVDFLTLVSKFHRRGIRIVMDAVFNHVYEHLYSSFEAVVPNYYFRRNRDGHFFNASGCGNDFASERAMARKLIVDASLWWIKYYHIDGFRFDLMGLIDVDTINIIYKQARHINPNFIIYGEGWNMNSGNNLKLANSNNYLWMPNVAHFNDNFRDIVIGNLYDKNVGFGLDNIVFREPFKEVACASSLNLSGHGSRFNNAVYSINFVECHDNNTLFDKLLIMRPNDKRVDLYHRVNFVNSLVMLSFGVPFIHAGQEIGLTKNGNGNTYNAGDALNMFDYSLLKNRWNMVKHFRFLAKTRKSLRIYHTTNMRELERNISIEDIDNGGLLFTFKTGIDDNNKNKIHLFINPSFLPLYYNKNKAIGGVVVDPIAIKVMVE